MLISFQMNLKVLECGKLLVQHSNNLLYANEIISGFTCSFRNAPSLTVFTHFPLLSTVFIEENSLFFGAKV